jgi:hypothetical protein
MKRLVLLIPFALPILFTAVTLVLVTVNRSGGRGPTRLTERDTGLTSFDDENSAANLRLVWHSVPGTADTWLNREKLRELGFDTSVDPSSREAPRHYGRALPRDVFIAFELQENPIVLESPGPRPVGPLSRLVPVDAARDAETLEARYPDPATHLIAQGMVRPTLQGVPSRSAFVTGWVVNITPSRIHIPPSLAGNLPRHTSESERQPGAARLPSNSFTVSVRYGTRWEPWVVDVR